ncbi:uncharacterized protein V1516DRAFT_690041 [Lipomyces oligophaga]|uniref:uncharacterized protein n=1 Tax=Lipomyces oligophaga TaxID=45792 RepID=UPI0034CF9424
MSHLLNIPSDNSTDLVASTSTSSSSTIASSSSVPLSPAISSQIPQDLLNELSSIPNYVFDLSSVTPTSYGSWHVHGTLISVSDVAVLARISPSQRALGLEQEFTVVRHLQRLDPSYSHFIRAFSFIRLPVSGAVVSIFEDLGHNDLLDFSSALFSTAVRLEHPSLDSNVSEPVSAYDPSASPPYRIITLPQFLDFAIGASMCLQVLHLSHNIVHGEIRDDAFVFNSSSNTVKIVQFGSSSRARQQSMLDNASIEEHFESFALSPSYVYLSPEQTGRASALVDHRTDIYSLGIVFFSILSNRLPYYGSAMQILNQILHSSVPTLETLRPDIPPIVNSVIQKMTAKDPHNRYHSVSGLLHDLYRLQSLVLGKCKGGDDIESFELGANDFSSVFVLPSQLIGRSAEIDFIMSIVRKFAKRRSTDDNLHTVSTSLTSSYMNSSARGSNSTRPSTGTQQSEGMLISNGIDHQSDISDTISSTTSRSVKSVTSGGSSRSTPNFLATRAAQIGRSHKHRTEVITIRSYPGIGKTAVIQALHNPMRKYGLYGRCNGREKTRLAFEPVAKLMSSLLKQVLAENQEIVTQFYLNLHAKLGSHWRHLSRFLHLIPELASFLEIEKKSRQASDTLQQALLRLDEDRSNSGTPPVGKEFSETESTTASSSSGIRISTTSAGQEGSVNQGHTGFFGFELLKNTAGSKMHVTSFLLATFRALSEMFVVTIVIADSHVLDEESLEMILSLVNSKLKIIVIFTYREDVTLPAPLQLFLDSGYPRLTKIQLRPLNRVGVEEYICRTLHRSPEDISELVDFCIDRLKGNPLYLGSFLTELNKTGVIRFSFRTGRWVYDSIERVKDAYVEFMSHADIDISFMLHRLLEFPRCVRNFIGWASLLEPPFSFRIVQKIYARNNQRDTSSSDEVATNDDWMVQDSDDKSISSLQTLIQAGIIIAVYPEGTFTFVHNRCRRAALALIRNEDLASKHLVIAEVLIDEPEQNSAYVCEHLLACMPLLQDRPNRARYRKEFLTAGSYANRDGSLLLTEQYYRSAVELLQADCWNDDAEDGSYSESFKIYFKLAKVLFSRGRPDEALEIACLIQKHARSWADRTKCYSFRSQVHFLRGEYDKVIQVVMPALSQLKMKGIYDLEDMGKSERFWDLYHMIESSTDEELLNRERIDDPVVLAANTLAGRCLSGIYMVSPEQFSTATMIFVSSELNLGADDYLGLAYIYLSMVAIFRFRMYHFASRLHDLGLKAQAKVADPLIQSIGLGCNLRYLEHMFTPFQNSMHDLCVAASHAFDLGDRVAILQLQALEISMKFYLFSDMQSVIEFGESILRETDCVYSFADSIITIRGITQLAKALSGLTKLDDPFHILSDKEHDTVVFNEALFSKTLSSSTITRLSHYIFALFLYGYHDEVYEAAKKLIYTEGFKSFSCTRSTVHCWYIMCLSMLCIARRDDTEPAKREYLIARVREVLQNLDDRSAAAPEVNLTVRGILRLSLADISGNLELALKYHEEVISECNARDLKLDTAFCHMITGSMCVRRKLTNIGYEMIRRAVSIFRDCGALGVVNRINQSFPEAINLRNESLTKSVGVQTALVSSSAMETEPFDSLVPKSGGSLTRDVAIAFPDLGGVNPDNTLYQGDVQISSERDDDNGGVTLDILDLTSIIKSSQVISSEIDMDTLLMKMIEIFTSTTRADNCAMVLNEDGKFRVAAMGTADHIESFKYPHQSLNAVQERLFTPAVSYVSNTGEALFISNLSEDEMFAKAGSKWLEQHPEGRSLLVHPVLHKSIVLGVIYLEAAPHSFTTRHMEVISILSQQMGISISNAVLFKNIRKATMANALMIESQNASLRAARESEARFVATLETLPCIIWIADPPPINLPEFSVPHLEYLNHFWYDLCGTDAPGAADDAYLSQIHPDDQCKFISSLKRSASGTYEPVDIRIRTKDNVYRWHVCRGTPLKNEDGVTTKWIGVVVDIDDQRRTQEDALKTMRLKEEASRMKSEFLANMSHEIRTPIAGVIGMTDLLIETELNSEQRDFANNILLCADALLSVISDVLDFSKIEVGKLELTNEPFDVAKVLTDTLSILSFPVAKKGLLLINKIQFSQDTMPLVMGDSGRFKQIAMNLLTNAVKFTKKGYITLSAVDKKIAEDTIEITVSIEDTGIGIAPSVLSKLFAPFQQGDNSTARQFGGTGLGLSISKNLVQLMNGTIGLTSEYGRGTIATLTVPFKIAPTGSTLLEITTDEHQSMVDGLSSRAVMRIADMVSPVSQPTSPEMEVLASDRLVGPLEDFGLLKIESAAGRSRSSSLSFSNDNKTRSIRILVVEDNLINQKIAINILKKFSFQVEAAENGQEALRALEQRLQIGEPFDLVLMDCQMPLMDGYEATRRVRQHFDTRISEVPVIAMTANAVTGDREKCLEAGMSDYLPKPVKKNLLGEVIAKWVGPIVG